MNTVAAILLLALACQVASLRAMSLEARHWRCGEARPAHQYLLAFGVSQLAMSLLVLAAAFLALLRSHP